MMTNLFSEFDPACSFFNLNLNWLSLSAGFICLCGFYSMRVSRLRRMVLSMSRALNAFLYSVNGSSSGVFSLFALSLFFFIFGNNILGLPPYIFTATTQLVVSIALALPVWVTFLLYGMIKKTTHTLAHFLPVGTPVGLMSAVVCIELISSIIRPGTLAVRLSANMMAGHLMLLILGSSVFELGGSYLSSFFILFGELVLMGLEMAISTVQAFVFMTLIALYFGEILD